MPTVHRKIRDALVASIAHNVAALVERNRRTELERVMEAAGYINNINGRTCQSLAKAILALAVVIERSSLENAADAAAFHRHLAAGEDWSRANARSEDALRAAGVDVEARTARLDRLETNADARFA